jgi:hypothetical protein
LKTADFFLLLFRPIPVQFRCKPVQVIVAYSRTNYFATTVTVTAVAKEKRSMLLHLLRQNDLIIEKL